MIVYIKGDGVYKYLSNIVGTLVELDHETNTGFICYGNNTVIGVPFDIMNYLEQDTKCHFGDRVVQILRADVDGTVLVDVGNNYVRWESISDNRFTVIEE